MGSFSYDDQFGLVFEGGWVWANAFGLSLRYTKITYTASDLLDQKGSNLSLRGSYRF